jgi:hypothetical protein
MMKQLALWAPPTQRSAGVAERGLSSHGKNPSTPSSRRIQLVCGRRQSQPAGVFGGGQPGTGPDSTSSSAGHRPGDPCRTPRRSCG